MFGGKVVHECRQLVWYGYDIWKVSWKRDIENLFFFCYIIVAFNIA